MRRAQSYRHLPALPRQQLRHVVFLSRPTGIPGDGGTARQLPADGQNALDIHHKARSTFAGLRQFGNDAFDTNIAPVPAFAQLRRQRQLRMACRPEKSANEKRQQPASECEGSPGWRRLLVQLPARHCRRHHQQRVTQ